jgi:hypothetical protein
MIRDPTGGVPVDNYGKKLRRPADQNIPDRVNRWPDPLLLL